MDGGKYGWTDGRIDKKNGIRKGMKAHNYASK
jgi:hypothetical protein